MHRSNIDLETKPILPKRFSFLRGNSSSQTNISGFSLIELSVSLLLVSAMGLGISNYLSKNTKNLSSSDTLRELDQDVRLVNRQLTEDIRQAVFINPSCLGNALSSSTSINCSSIIIRGGVTPLPATNKSDLNVNSDFSLPSNLEVDVDNLTKETDAVRLALFDFDDQFDCALYKDESVQPINPSQSTEELYLDSDCVSKISAGKIYIIVEPSSDNSTVYSNVFQITSITDSSGYLTVETSSISNKYNQAGGLGLSGFTSQSRIFPIKLVEYAVDQTNLGLYRREISPTSQDMTGLGSWKVVNSKVEGIHFHPITVTSAGATEHNRSMILGADIDGNGTIDITDPENNDGIEDIRGLSPRLVLRSSSETNSEIGTDNPMTSAVESDNYGRRELKFFAGLKNFPSDN